MGTQFRMKPTAIDALAEKLMALPKAEPEALGKRHTILRLRPAIEDLKAKNYSLAAIASEFKKNGLPITVSALKSILSHGDEGGASGSKKRRKRKAHAQGPLSSVSSAHATRMDAKSQGEASTKEPGSAAESPKSTTAQEVKKEAKPDAKAGVGEKAFAESVAKAGESTKEGRPEPKGSFVFRPDTKDI